MNGKLCPPMKDLNFPVRAVSIMMRQDIAKKTRVSLTAVTIIPAELKGFTLVGTQRFEWGMFPPYSAKGTVMDPARFADHSRAKNATIQGHPSKTALIRKRKRRDVDGIATTQHQPITWGNRWHHSGPTGMTIVFLLVKVPGCGFGYSLWKTAVATM